MYRVFNMPNYLPVTGLIHFSEDFQTKTDYAHLYILERTLQFSETKIDACCSRLNSWFPLDLMFLLRNPAAAAAALGRERITSPRGSLSVY